MIYYFERTLQVLYTVGADKSASAKVKKLLTTNILDLCAYSTLRYSILNVRKNLNQIPLTINVYDQACKEFNIAPKIRKTLIITENIFEEAKKWNIQVDMMRTIYTEIKDWVDMLGDFVPSS